MIKRGTPKNKDQYIPVRDEDKIYGLSKLGYYGAYIDCEYIWFEKCEELEQLLEA